ncbi:MAG: hypothetical protein WCF33_12700 [Pseudonocardiaceae bacterium]
MSRRELGAAVVAQRTGETGPDVAYFGSTNVAMYRMTSALECGDSELAVELAGSVQPGDQTGARTR